MKQMYRATLSMLLAATTSLFPFSGESESSIDGGKTSIVLSGTIQTHKGHVYQVQEITFNKLTRKIVLYEVPDMQSNVITDEKEMKEQKERPGDVIQLKDNPTQSSTEFLVDLESIAQISVPKPWQRWMFKKNHREVEFIEVVITFKEKNNETHYLVERDKKIFAKEDDTTIEVPLVNLKNLTIAKIELRSYEKSKKLVETKPAECACPHAVEKQKDEAIKKTTIETAHRHHRKGRLARMTKDKALTA